MKKTVITLLVVTMLISLLPISASLAETYATVFSGNKFGVRLRSGPATSYENIVTLPSGTTVIMLEQGAVWSRVQAGTTVGYMMSQYLVGGGDSGSVTYEYTGIVYAGNGSRTWLRSAPNGKRLGLYADNTPLKILKYDDDWSKVMIGSSIGYMVTRYISIERPPEPTPTPTPAPFSSVRLNYAYPLVGDTLRPVLTPENATATYKWQRVNDDGSLTDLGTGATYTVTKDDLNKKIRLTATGAGNYAGTSQTITSEVVTNDKRIASVAIYNSKTDHDAPVVGDVLSTIVAPSSANVTYSWRVAGSVKSTTPSYTVTAADVGKQIQVYVSGLDPFTGNAYSQATKAVLGANAVSAVKLSTTSPVIGQAISPVTVPSGLSVSCIWYVDGAQVGTGATYTPTADTLGHVVTVRVTGTGEHTGTAISAPSRPIAQAVLTSVSIDIAAPAVDSVLTAKVLPADATALYQWYSEDDSKTVIGNSATFFVDKKYAGKKLYVVATGSGVYGGEVTSARTAAVLSVIPLTGVTLDNPNPVVGDVLKATLTPATAVNGNNNVYLWYAGGTLMETSTNDTYTVKPEDKDAKIYVKVQGGSPNAGTVTSAVTNAVKATTALTAANIYGTSIGAYVNGGTVYAGQKLRADPVPAQAALNGNIGYQWLRSDNVVVGTGREYTLATSDEGKTIQLTIYDKSYSAATSTGYSGSPVSRVNVAKTTGIGTIDLSRIVPKQAASPVTSLTGTFKNSAGTTLNYSATLKWTPGLDQYGHFVNGQAYTVNATFSLPGGYSLSQSTLIYGVSTPPTSAEVTVNTLKATFAPMTGNQPVTLLYISGLEAPVVGKAPDGSIDTTSQFVGTSVEWKDSDSKTVTTFEIGKTYTATIGIQTNNGYEFNDDQKKLQGKPLFTVWGAESAKVTDIQSNTAKIEATYTTTVSGSSAYVTANRTTVPIGASVKYVQCNAVLTNYIGNQDNLKWNWTVSQNTRPGTFIDGNGTLTIDWSETVGTQLIVTASLKADARYSASITINLTAEGETAGDVSVEFIKAPDKIHHDKDNDQTFTYVATVNNSNNENVYWSLTGNKADGTKISSDGTLTLSQKETATSLRIIATSQADNTKSAPIDVTVVYPTTETNVAINFTEIASSLAPGKSATFKATLENGLDTSSIKFIVGEGATITNVQKPTVKGGNGTYSCSVTINDDTPINKNISLIAVYEKGTSGVNVDPVAVVITVIDPTNNKSGVIISGPDTVGEGTTNTFTATDDANKPISGVTWAVTGGIKADGTAPSSTLISANGDLQIGADEAAKTLTITATYGTAPDATSAAKIVTVQYQPVTVKTELTDTTVHVNAEVKMTVVFSKPDGSTKTVWKSSDTNVATVDQNGMVKGISQGTAIIEASYADDPRAKSQATVTIEPSVSIFGPISVTYAEGIAGSVKYQANDSLAASVTMAVLGGKTGTVIGNDGTLTLDQDENATSLTINAKSDNGEASLTVAITQQPAVVLTVKTASALIKPSETMELNVTANAGTLTWASSDTKIVTVDANGKITGGGTEGKATITVTSNLDKTKTATVAVTVSSAAKTTMMMNSVPNNETPLAEETIVTDANGATSTTPNSNTQTNTTTNTTNTQIGTPPAVLPPTEGLNMIE